MTVRPGLCNYYGCENRAVRQYCAEHSPLRERDGGGLLTLVAGIVIGIALTLIFLALG